MDSNKLAKNKKAYMSKLFSFVFIFIFNFFAHGQNDLTSSNVFPAYKKLPKVADAAVVITRIGYDFDAKFVKPGRVTEGPMCGGCLIAPDAILTARHCFSEINGQLMHINRIVFKAKNLDISLTPQFSIGLVDSFFDDEKFDVYSFVDREKFATYKKDYHFGRRQLNGTTSEHFHYFPTVPSGEYRGLPIMTEYKEDGETTYAMNDWAVIRLKHPILDVTPLTLTSEKEVLPSENVYILAPSKSFGKLVASSVRIDADASVKFEKRQSVNKTFNLHGLGYEGFSEDGFSGSCVVTEDGRVIGVHNSSDDKKSPSGHLNKFWQIRATKASTILEAMKK